MYNVSPIKDSFFPAIVILVFGGVVWVALSTVIFMFHADIDLTSMFS